MPAVKGDRTLAQLAEQFDVHPNQITAWKAQLEGSAAAVFGPGSDNVAVGRERVIAATDCGLGGRVYSQIAWAKLETLAQGAALATKQLWR